MYEVKKHYPKKKWVQHGIPVEIDTRDDRGTCVGSLHLDFAQEEGPNFPCYALFLDAGNALILKGPRPTLLTDELKLQAIAKPEFATYIRGNAIKTQGAADMTRVGVASFVGAKQSLEETGEDPKPWDEEKLGKFSPDKILSVTGSDSWGPIKVDEPKVWVTVV